VVKKKKPSVSMFTTGVANIATGWESTIQNWRKKKTMYDLKQKRGRPIGGRTIDRKGREVGREKSEK